MNEHEIKQAAESKIEEAKNSFTTWKKEAENKFAQLQKESEAIWSKHRRQILLDGGVDGGVVIGLSVYQHIYIFLIQLFQHIH